MANSSFLDAEMQSFDSKKFTVQDSHKLIVIVCIAIFLALCALFWPFVADDAYIVGRYAKNAAAGNGLVFNVGEQVSALTSPLHALLETVLAYAGLDPVKGYRIIAPILILAAWFAAWRETQLNGHRLFLFSVISLFSPFLVLWTVGGLETPLLTGMSTLLAARLILIQRAGVATPRDFIFLGLLGGLMFLTRYDSVLVTGPVLLAIAIVEYRRPAVWGAAALCISLASSWLIFSALYYGDIFPTSFYIKFAHGGRAPIDSVSALLNFCLLSGLVLLALLAKPASPADASSLSKAIVRGGAFSFVLFILYASRAAGQHMMFGYRLFVPYLMMAGLVISVSLANPRTAVSAVSFGWQTVMVAIVAFVGVNPAPLTRLPGLDRAYAEYEFITPNIFQRWNEMLKEDAREISKDWIERGINTRPTIYLRSGGMGYHLLDFYVYESLISYRHDCLIPIAAMIAASHYMQQLGFSLSGSMVENLGRARDDVAEDVPLLFSTKIDSIGGGPTGYLFGPDPTPLKLGRTINATCEFSPELQSEFP